MVPVYRVKRNLYFSVCDGYIVYVLYIHFIYCVYIVCTLYVYLNVYILCIAANTSYAGSHRLEKLHNANAILEVRVRRCILPVRLLRVRELKRKRVAFLWI